MWCYAVTVVVWLIINALDALWLYFYVQACVNPNPRTGVNKTHTGFEAYTVIMYLFGFCWGIVNLGAAWVYYGWVFDDSSRYSRQSRSSWITVPKAIFNIVVGLPVWAFLIIMPFFGGWIVVPLAQDYAWNHRCDSYPMYAVLDGKGYYSPSYVANVAHFYQTGSDVSMFTYDYDDNSDFFTFHLREWDVDQSTIPVQFYPTLQSVQYNFINDTVTGNCTVPIVPGNTANTTTTTVPCLTGDFNPDNFMSWDLSSRIPLNSTQDLSVVPQYNTSLRIVDKQWSFGDDAPSLILDTVESGNLADIVLRTAVTKRKDCTQLKVCLNGVPNRVGSAVGAEVLAPVGLILIRQGDYSFECTAPKDNN